MVGVVHNGLRLKGVLAVRFGRTGATTPVFERADPALQVLPQSATLLQGTALGRFSMVDIRALSDYGPRPPRHKPNLASTKAALRKVRGGQRK